MSVKNCLGMLPKLVRASLEGDRRTIEASSLGMIRSLRKEYPSVADEIAKALSFTGVGASAFRSIGLEPMPTDRDSLLSLATISEPEFVEPVIFFDERIINLIEKFILERKMMTKLLSAGVTPPTSLLLYGPPGVGKTFLTHFLSFRLSMPLITLDLAASISSYLGKTGQNLKKVLDYAKSTPCILFLDEFDAVAKRRDDPTDIGELKRIVNVLLKELEEWPVNSIVIAATNNANMLDKAIWRRFDRAIEIGLPDTDIRKKLWSETLGSRVPEFDSKFIGVMAYLSEGMSPADICQMSNQILRQIILEESEPMPLIIEEFRNKMSTNSSKFNGVFARAVKDALGSQVTQAQIAKWLKISTPTVSYHLKNERSE